MKQDIERLKEFAHEFDRPVVVALALHKTGNRYQITTYGKNKQLCKLAASFGDQIHNCIQNGQIVPPAVEPKVHPPTEIEGTYESE